MATDKATKLTVTKAMELLASTKQELVRWLVQANIPRVSRAFRDAIILKEAETHRSVEGFYRSVAQKVSNMLGVVVTAEAAKRVCLRKA